MHLHPRLQLCTRTCVQVADIKAALRQQGIRYPKGALKAELAELLRWSSQSGLLVATRKQLPKLPSARQLQRTPHGPTVSPETYGWDASTAAGTSAGGSAAAAAPAGGIGCLTARSAASEAARCAAGQYGPDEPVRPGIAQFEDVATAAEAAVEKKAAGENRAVEHVALHAEASMDLGAGGYDDNGAQAAGLATDTAASGKQKRQRKHGGEKGRARGGKPAAAENGDAATAQGADAGTRLAATTSTLWLQPQTGSVLLASRRLRAAKVGHLLRRARATVHGRRKLLPGHRQLLRRPNSPQRGSVRASEAASDPLFDRGQT